MDKLRKEVEEDVSRLLAMLDPTCDPETYVFVRDKLTRMVIISVAPPSCQRKDHKDDDSFSARKESFIAP